MNNWTTVKSTINSRQIFTIYFIYQANAGISKTSRRVKIVQYSEVFDELYKAVTGMGHKASLIKFLKLK